MRIRSLVCLALLAISLFVQTQFLPKSPLVPKVFADTTKIRYLNLTGDNPSSMVYDSARNCVWVVLYLTNRLAKIDVATENVTYYSVGDPWTLALDPNGDVWVANRISNGIDKFNVNNESFTFYNFPSGRELDLPVDVKYMNGEIWVLGYLWGLYEFNYTTGDLLRFTVATPQLICPEAYGRCMAQVGDALWVAFSNNPAGSGTAQDMGMMSRFNTTTREWDANITGFDVPNGITQDDEYIYVSEGVNFDHRDTGWITWDQDRGDQGLGYNSVPEGQSWIFCVQYTYGCEWRVADKIRLSAHAAPYWGDYEDNVITNVTALDEQNCYNVTLQHPTLHTYNMTFVDGYPRIARINKATLETDRIYLHWLISYGADMRNVYRDSNGYLWYLGHFGNGTSASFTNLGIVNGAEFWGGYTYNPCMTEVKYITASNTTVDEIWFGAKGSAHLGILDEMVSGNISFGDLDFNKDGKIDIRDIALVAKAFGSVPGNPGWNPSCDITGSTPGVPDGRVDIRDIALVAKHFGETL